MYYYKTFRFFQFPVFSIEYSVCRDKIKSVQVNEPFRKLNLGIKMNKVLFYPHFFFLSS